MAMTKIKGLQQWCRRMTDGYAHVDVANFTTAWRDGMAFCAIIHRFRPDLIDYDALSPENVFDNCKLAFEVAEKELDIPAFLEAEDMARLKVPDKLSVITYVSQYYNFLHALPQLGGPGVKGKVASKSPAGGKRPPNIDTGQAPSSKKVATGEDGKENVSAGIEKTRHGTVGDKCNICGNKVYLLERHIEAGKLYHRSCYRHSELSPTNKVYTRSPFLSPALSKETPPLSPSAHMKTSSSNSDQHQHRTPGSHHHLHTGGSGGVLGALTAKADGEASKSSSQFSFPASAASSDSPRKIDSAGLKHSLSETDRGDAKKSKLQVTNENSVGQNQKANAIIDRLKNLKGKYDSPQKENDSLSVGKKSDHKTPVPKEKEVFPLSGKESKQLEKRRDEILSAEKKAEKSSRAGARNVPLIFQQKDSDKATVSTSASSVLSKANHSSTPITSHSSNISSVISNTPTSTKNTNTLNPDLTQRKTAIKVVKAELVSKKEAEDPENKSSLQNIMKQDKEKGKSNTKSAPDVKDNEKGDIASLQKKFLKSGEGGSTTVTPHPVAKARVHKPSDVSQNDINTVPTPSLRKNNSDGSATPKAAPRKSLIEKSVEINVSLGGSKEPSFTGANLLKVKPPNSARSSGSESPPPLPSTAPPPLPTSPQPSLPSSAVINLDNVKSKIKSSKEGKLGGGDIKSGQKEEITTHGSVKSRVAVSSQAVATTTTKRLSSPAIHDPSLTVFETQDKEEKQVLSGLLSSLAGVRGRSSSTPGISGLPFTTPSEPIPSESSAALPSSSLLSKRSPSPSFTPAEVPSSKTVIKTIKDRKTSELSVNIASKNVSLDLVKDVNKTSSTDTSKASGIHKKDNHMPQSISPSIGKVPEALSVLNNLKKVKDSKPSESSDSILKTCSSTKIELVSENVHTKEKKKGALSASKENLNHISTKATSSDVLKQESSDHKASENFKTVKLRQVTQPGANLTNPGVPSPASDFKLDKYENKTKEEKNKSHQPPAVSKSLFNKSEGDATTKSKTESNEHSSSKVQAKSQKPHNLYEEDELPDWKAALEERKKKLRENTPKHDNIKVAISKSKEIPEVKDDKKSDKIQISPKNSELNPRSEKDKPDNYRSPRAKSPSPALLKTSDAKPSVSLAGEKSAADKKLPSTPQPKNRIKSGDWKHDAEMKIAALGGFDSEEEVKEEKQPTKPKRTLPKLPDVVPDLQKAIKASDKTKSQEKKAKEVSVEAPTESVPEFLTGISKLKPVKPQEENKQMMLNTKKTKPAPVPPVVNEDFRQRLQNLKHIHGGGETIAESKNHSSEAMNSQDAVKPSLSGSQNTPVQPKSMPPSSLREDIKNTNNNKNKEKVPPKLTQPSPLRGDNNNFNNKKSKEKKDVNSKKSLMDSINLASSPDVSDEEGQSMREKRSPQRHSTPIQENGKSSPKAKKKKIPFFGKNKKEKLESPAESPINPKKKIEAPVNLDFNKSSEFEASLSDATARLSIEDKKTPPQRPPPPQAKHKKMPSPKHISAIELQQQLLDIDSRLTDLELRGRDLEDSIRNVNVLEEDDDSLMIKWFELVSEKNDLVRQEADLMYMSREQDLETEQDHIEFQLRYLMNKSDADKSGAEKEEEEYLIQRKVELVEQRNRIVDSMDEDRLRYVEEDRDIEVTLRDKGLWKDSNGTFKAIKGKKVSNSTFYT